jgi:hypothetical protein
MRARRDPELGPARVVLEGLFWRHPRRGSGRWRRIRRCGRAKGRPVAQHVGPERAPAARHAVPQLLRVAGQRPDQRDQADHERGDAEAEGVLAVELGHLLARTEHGEQADDAAAEAEQAAGDAQWPLFALPKQHCPRVA